jgi:hypothetical protein
LLMRPIKINMVKKLLLIFLGSVMMWSCTEPEKPKPVVKQRVFPQYHVALDEIVRTSDGVIRGVNLNSNTALIKKTETTLPAEEESDHLYFEYKIDSLTNYSVSYALQKDSLEEINVEVNCKDAETCSKIFGDLKDYYEKKLPNPTEDKGYVVYNCFEGQRKPFVVSLSDNSTPTEGIINLVIYKDK